MKKIAIVSGNRADYGILKWVAKEIQKEFELQLIIMGDIDSLESTMNLVIEDNLRLNVERIFPLEIENDSNLEISKQTGILTLTLAQTLDDLKPDLLFILGDRYEILAAVTAALLLKIPVAHLCGGDITEGAFDDSIRHAITKMSHLHFVSNEQSKKIVEQMGENPNYVFNVGNPGLDILDNFIPTSKEKLEKEFEYKFGNKNLLVTFHPETLSDKPVDEEFRKLLYSIEVVKILGDLTLDNCDFNVLITYPNTDPGNQKIIELINEFVDERSWAFAAKYLGQQNYLSFVYHFDMVIGNSSSGLYEVPSLGKPTINIGDRQKGRLRADSVIDCECDCEAYDIIKAIKKGFNLNCSNVVNPYRQNGNSSKKIVDELKKIDDFKKLLVKKFNIRE
jgi:UDP-hydrolysing UDP-N-acetyl-D-glucosamine 2-epimerase